MRQVAEQDMPSVLMIHGQVLPTALSISYRHVLDNFIDGADGPTLLRFWHSCIGRVISESAPGSSSQVPYHQDHEQHLVSQSSQRETTGLGELTFVIQDSFDSCLRQSHRGCIYIQIMVQRQY